MSRSLVLAALLAAPTLVSSQPLVPEAPMNPASPAALVVEPPSGEDLPRLRLAVVVEKQAAENGCGSSSDSSCGDGGCDGGSADCGSDAGDAACLTLTGCAVLTGAAAYGVYRLVKRRRAPDSLAVVTAGALAEHLAVHAEIVASEEADAVVTVREAPARRGVGLADRDRQLVVTAVDRRGRPLALGDGPLPSAHLMVSAGEVIRPETARRLATRLARRR